MGEHYGHRSERSRDSHEKTSLLSPRKQWGMPNIWWGSAKDDQVNYQCMPMPVVLSMLTIAMVSCFGTFGTCLCLSAD